MVKIMSSSERLLDRMLRVRKYSGMPITAPQLKQSSCRFVRLKKILVLILDRSLGTSA